MPVMNDPQQFPHMLFWTPEGLIKKILLQQQPPVVTFWLDKDRQKKITDDNMMDIWVGADVPDVEIDSESEEENSDDDEVEVRKDVWGDSDTRQLEGVTLSVVITNLTGEQVEAEEYIPGSKLVVSLTVSKSTAVFSIETNSVKSAFTNDY